MGVGDVRRGHSPPDAVPVGRPGPADSQSSALLDGFTGGFEHGTADTDAHAGDPADDDTLAPAVDTAGRPADGSADGPRHVALPGTAGDAETGSPGTSRTDGTASAHRTGTHTVDAADVRAAGTDHSPASDPRATVPHRTHADVARAARTRDQHTRNGDHVLVHVAGGDGRRSADGRGRGGR
ncbi:hypothetical protein ACFYOV_16945 [Streptomyces sp. NPDC005931]|uniref:hypothetical protein n=1 Tax=Streptomyces sp. NPDC005931 TaxID=3364737 RepID=UPI00368D3269